MDSKDVIIGPVFEFYADEISARSGRPALTEEIYAKRNSDMESWTVYRMRALNETDEPGSNDLISPLFTALAGPHATHIDLPEIIASHVSQEKAISLMRESIDYPGLDAEGKIVNLIFPDENLPARNPAHDLKL